MRDKVSNKRVTDSRWRYNWLDISFEWFLLSDFNHWKILFSGIIDKLFRNSCFY